MTLVTLHIFGVGLIGVLQVLFDFFMSWQVSHWALLK
jgi:hypothetical protein